MDFWRKVSKSLTFSFKTEEILWSNLTIFNQTDLRTVKYLELCQKYVKSFQMLDFVQTVSHFAIFLSKTSRGKL